MLLTEFHCCSKTFQPKFFLDNVVKSLLMFIDTCQKCVSYVMYIIITGGSNGSEYLDSVECYDPSQLKWVPVTSLSFPRFGAAAVVLSNRDYVAPLDHSNDGLFSPPLSP